MYQKFIILSVKGNSVRVHTGIVTFDVLVIEHEGRLKMQLPPNIYIANKGDFNDLVYAVMAEYHNSLDYNNHRFGDNHYEQQTANT